MRWRSVYAAAFGFRQARVYTMGRGQCVRGPFRQASPRAPLPSPTHAAFLKISPFFGDSGNLSEEPTVFLAGRRCEFKHFLFRRNAAPAPAKIQGRVDRTIPPVAVLSRCTPSPSSRRCDGIVLEDHPPGENKKWRAGQDKSAHILNPAFAKARLLGHPIAGTRSYRARCAPEECHSVQQEQFRELLQITQVCIHSCSAARRRRAYRK